jgi:hypothetical protein
MKQLNSNSPRMALIGLLYRVLCWKSTWTVHLHPKCTESFWENKGWLSMVSRKVYHEQPKATATKQSSCHWEHSQTKCSSQLCSGLCTLANTFPAMKKRIGQSKFIRTQTNEFFVHFSHNWQCKTINFTEESLKSEFRKHGRGSAKFWVLALLSQQDIL